MFKKITVEYGFYLINRFIEVGYEIKSDNKIHKNWKQAL